MKLEPVQSSGFPKRKGNFSHQAGVAQRAMCATVATGLQHADDTPFRGLQGLVNKLTLQV